MHLGLGHNYILLPPASPGLLAPPLTGSEKDSWSRQCRPHLGNRGVGDPRMRDTTLGHTLSHLIARVHSDQL